MKMLTIILLLIALPVMAQYSEVMGFRIAENPGDDGWQIGHLFKGSLDYGLLRVCKVKPGWSIAGAVVMAYMWEFFIDGRQNQFLWLEPDPAGADVYGDPLWDLLGASLAFIGESVWRIHIQLKRNQLLLSYRW